MNKEQKFNGSMYVDMLPEHIQKEIEVELRKLDISEEDVQRGLNSRLHDLSDTIDVQIYIK